MGYGSSVVAWLVGCYYNVIIAWCLYYLGSSFTVSRNKIIFLIQFLNVAIADLLLVTYYLSKQNKNYRFAGIFFYTICTVCRMFTSLVSFTFNPTLIVLQKVCVNSYENSRRYFKNLKVRISRVCVAIRGVYVYA